MVNGILQNIANPVVGNFHTAAQKGIETTRLNRQQRLLQQMREGVMSGKISQDDAIRQIATVDPQTAVALNQLFGGVEKRKMSNFFTSIGAAMAISDPQKQKDYLNKQVSTILPANHPMNTALSAALTEDPAGPDAALQKMLMLGQGAGFLNFPQPRTGLTPEQHQEKIEIERMRAEIAAKQAGTAQQALGVRQSELRLAREKEQRAAGEIKPTMQRILDTAQQAAIDSQKEANSFDLLVRDYDQIGFGGGVSASVSEFLKDALGTQDDVSALRRKFRGIRASQATKNLPPGPASDKDIALALSGFPPDNAPAKTISSFLRGASKLARIDAAWNNFKAEYISENGDSRGLLKSWKDNKVNVINQTLEGMAAGTGVDPQATIIMRHPTMGDITEADIQETIRQNPGLTREALLQQLRGQ